MAPVFPRHYHLVIVDLPGLETRRMPGRFHPPAPSMRIVADIEYTAGYMPKVNAISISGTDIRALREREFQPRRIRPRHQRPNPIGATTGAQVRYSQRKPSPQRLRWPTDGDGKCIVQNSVSVSQ